MPSIKLESSDHEVFEVDVTIAKMSTTIKTMLEALDMDDDDDEAVPLPMVKGAYLKMVIEWCTHHKDDPPELEEDEENKRTDDICSWDARFLHVDCSTLFELITVANFLNIKGLMDVTCKTVANMLKDKSPEEICMIFNIEDDSHPNDDSPPPEEPAEEEQVQNENATGEKE